MYAHMRDLRVPKWRYPTLQNLPNLSYPLAFAHAHAALEDWAGELLLLLVMFFERLRKENLRYRTDLEESHEKKRGRSDEPRFRQKQKIQPRMRRKAPPCVSPQSLRRRRE
jgi:hypothetical protein